MISRRIAGDCMAICAVWLCWATLAPIVAGPIKGPSVLHECPAPRVVHYVGSDLRTGSRVIDLCSQPRRSF